MSNFPKASSKPLWHKVTVYNFHTETKPHCLKTGLYTGTFRWSNKQLPWTSCLGWVTTSTLASWCNGIMTFSGQIFIRTARVEYFFLMQPPEDLMFSSMVTKEPRVTPKYCSILIATGTHLWIKKRRYYPLSQSNCHLRYVLVQTFQDLNLARY